MLGLVLSGGGARGAYEAGVLRFLYEDLSPRLRRPLDFELICGTSIGALNGAWVGATGADGARRLSDFWRTLTPDSVYRFRAVDLVRAPEKFLRRAAPVDRAVSLFDPEPLYHFVRERMPWADLRRRIDSGALRGFVVTVTDVVNGRSVQFVDGFDTTRETGTSSLRPGRIGPEHCLASAAIPFIFEPVRVDGRYYVDGALRQNTPLSPAIQLGARRALVVGVKRERVHEAPATEAVAPSPAFLAGKALNALMLDPVEEDIRRVDRITAMLEWSERAYPGYLERLAREFRPYQPIHTLHLRPSEDIGRIAAELFRVCEPKLPWATRMLLKGVAASENPHEADLVSYLLFHHAFTGELEALGHRDAAAAEEALAKLLDSEDPGGVRPRPRPAASPTPKA